MIMCCNNIFICLNVCCCISYLVVFCWKFLNLSDFFIVFCLLIDKDCRYIDFDIENYIFIKI